MGQQLPRSGTSVAANCRPAGRARSKAEFIAKIGNVVEEADEAVFWLELIVEAEMIEEERLTALIQEAREFCAIFATSHRTARNLRKKPGRSS
jgi:four helix bundle protein